MKIFIIGMIAGAVSFTTGVLIGVETNSYEYWILGASHTGTFCLGMAR